MALSSTDRSQALSLSPLPLFRRLKAMVTLWIIPRPHWLCQVPLANGRSSKPLIFLILAKFWGGIIHNLIIGLSRGEGGGNSTGVHLVENSVLFQSQYWVLPPVASLFALPHYLPIPLLIRAPNTIPPKQSVDGVIGHPTLKPRQDSRIREYQVPLKISIGSRRPLSWPIWAEYQDRGANISWAGYIASSALPASQEFLEMS